MPIGWTWITGKGESFETRILQIQKPDYTDGSYGKAIKSGYITRPEHLYTQDELDKKIKKLRDKVIKAYNLIMKSSTNGTCKDWNEGWDIFREIIKENE